jgi:hypothetical protein
VEIGKLNTLRRDRGAAVRIESVGLLAVDSWLMTWCFRLRFDLGASAALTYDAAEWVIRDGPPERITLRPADGNTTIAEARRLSLHGRGYATESEAAAAGTQCGGWLILAFASLNVGADFGDRALIGMVTPVGLADMSLAAGTRVLNDVHGLMTYECEPQPRFVRVGTPTLQVGHAHQRLADAFNRAIALAAVPTSRQRLAYDLYAASFSESTADARFVMLMMALETLLEPQLRSDEAQLLVDELIATTRQSGLPIGEIRSIEGTLKWLRQESINRAGRRLASRLGGRTYHEEDPETFFTRCYTLRSQLVHGSDPRPSRTEVDQRAAQLELFVGHLIGESLLERS